MFSLMFNYNWLYVHGFFTNVDYHAIVRFYRMLGVFVLIIAFSKEQIMTQSC